MSWLSWSPALLALPSMRTCRCSREVTQYCGACTGNIVRGITGTRLKLGFPGESDAEFDETRRMVEELPFTYLHVFTYSARPGTPAAGFSGQVPVPVARDRNRILREIAAGKKRAFAQSLVGTAVEAITLQSRSAEFTEALTDNYLKLKVRGDAEPNRWRRVVVERSEGETLVGRICGANDVSAPAAVREARSAETR